MMCQCTMATGQTLFAEAMLDVEKGRVVEGIIIQIAEGTIVSIQTGAKRDALEPDSYIDLSDMTLLPGLIDTHTHLCDNTYLGREFDHWTYPAATFGIVGTVNARKTLGAGFTTVRDVSAPYFADVALRDAINKGWIDGPRMIVSGPMITMTGGHGDWGNWMGPQHEVSTQAEAVADGADAVRQLTRKHIQSGVDMIKIVATGGFGTPGSIPGAASYTVEEIAAAVDEAHKRGIKVAAHAHGEDGIRNALEAGVDSIEHGSMVTEELALKMKESQTFLVMDLLAAHYDLVEINQDYGDKELNSSNEEEYANYRSRFAAAYKAGAPMAFGTDASVFAHGRNAEQFALMVEAGMSPEDAVRSATIWAARLLGMEQETGTIAQGKWADLIAVRGNPYDDVTALTDIVFVMKSGKVYVGPPDDR